MIGTGGSALAKVKTKKSGPRLPAFRDDAEERKFWETHDPGEYFERTRPARVQVSAKFSERVRARSSRLRRKRAG
jgi:hypothetical protein